MSSNALLWPSQGTKPEERLDKYKWLRLPSQGIAGQVIPPLEIIWIDDFGNEFLNDLGETIVFAP